MKAIFLGIIFWVISCSSPPQEPQVEADLFEADFYRLASLRPAEVEYFGQLLVALETKDRRRQRETLRQIRRFGLRALEALLVGLEQGSANTQQGCLEALRNLKEGSIDIDGRSVPHREVLAIWYLSKIEQGYRNLSKEPMKIGQTTRDPYKGREVFRQYLCILFSEVGAPKMIGRLLGAIQDDPNVLVRAAGYRCCARLARASHFPKLIELYQNETDIAQDELWRALKTLTGKNYPNDPKIWAAWLKKGTY